MPETATGLLIEDVTPKGGALEVWALASAIRETAGFFALDAGLPTSDGERWSFFGASPAAVLEANADDARDPWERLREACATRRSRLDALRCSSSAQAAPTGRADPLPPFPSGGVAILGYDLGRRLERWPRLARRDLDLPDLHVAFHDAVVAVDHVGGRVLVTGLADAPDAVARLADAVRAASTTSARPTPSIDGIGDALTSTFSAGAYEAAVAEVRELIAAGDVYQVNLSQRFSAPAPAAPRDLWERLRSLSPAPFAAFCDLGGGRAVLSASPERFLRIAAPGASADPASGRRIESRPIKGTRPRGADPITDAALRAELAASAKDRAELAMIVDLVRNDLGRTARPGTVAVEDVFRVESFPAVHHLVATVSARLPDAVDPIDAVAAAFPAGSITGAPKIRAIEIIEEMEPVRRGFYTGAIGWIADTGALDLNVAIRTLVHDGARVHFHVGGGIVWGSEPAAEYQETLDKGRGFFELLGAHPRERLALVGAAGAPAGEAPR